MIIFVTRFVYVFVYNAALVADLSFKIIMNNFRKENFLFSVQYLQCCIRYVQIILVLLILLTITLQ